MEMRTLTKDCTVGEYKFSIAINRQILLEVFEKFPRLWKAIASTTSVKIEDGEVDDISKLSKLFELDDLMSEEMPKFIKALLPKMVTLAGSTLNIDEFVDYCVENEVDDLVNTSLFDFAILGFTAGKGEKKPKVKVTIE